MPGVLAAALVVLLALCAGCGDDDDPESDEARQSAVYSAILRDVALSLPATDDELSDRTVFVEPLDPESEIGLEVQAGVVLELEDLVAVTFIDDRAAAVDEEQPDQPVREESALVALGPVPEGRRRVDVAAERYRRAGATERLRYVVERVGGTWEVAERESLGSGA